MAFWNRERPDDIPTNRQAIARRDSILEEIGKLSADLAEVREDVKATSKVRGTQKALQTAQEGLAELRIEKSRIEEEFARERREIEHHVGLERERTTLEIEQARQQAKLDVREENLQAEKDRFQEHMDFYKEQMDKHIDDVKLLLNQVMTRIPTVNVDRKIRENYTGELTDGEGA
jgi:chromosome segregation ATPase